MEGRETRHSPEQRGPLREEERVPRGLPQRWALLLLGTRAGHLLCAPICQEREPQGREDSGCHVQSSDAGQ